MNTFTRITGLATLAMIGATAQAEVVCNRCEIIDVDQWTGTYVGSFWAHDRATFANPSLIDYQGWPLPWFINNVVIDVNETADVTISIAPVKGTAFTLLPNSVALMVDLYVDTGTACNATNVCRVNVGSGGITVLGTAVTEDGTQSITLTTIALTPGRYVYVIQGFTATPGESGYVGKIVVKRPRLGIGP